MKHFAIQLLIIIGLPFNIYTATCKTLSPESKNRLLNNLHKVREVITSELNSISDIITTQPTYQAYAQPAAIQSYYSEASSPASATCTSYDSDTETISLSASVAEETNAAISHDLPADNSETIEKPEPQATSHTESTALGVSIAAFNSTKTSGEADPTSTQAPTLCGRPITVEEGYSQEIADALLSVLNKEKAQKKAAAHKKPKDEKPIINQASSSCEGEGSLDSEIVVSPGTLTKLDREYWPNERDYNHFVKNVYAYEAMLKDGTSVSDKQSLAQVQIDLEYIKNSANSKIKVIVKQDSLPSSPQAVGASSSSSSTSSYNYFQQTQSPQLNAVPMRQVVVPFVCPNGFHGDNCTHDKISRVMMVPDPVQVAENQRKQESVRIANSNAIIQRLTNGKGQSWLTADQERARDANDPEAFDRATAERKLFEKRRTSTQQFNPNQNEASNDETERKIAEEQAKLIERVPDSPGTLARKIAEAKVAEEQAKKAAQQKDIEDGINNMIIENEWRERVRSKRPANQLLNLALNVVSLLRGNVAGGGAGSSPIPNAGGTIALTAGRALAVGVSATAGVAISAAKDLLSYFTGGSAGSTEEPKDEAKNTGAKSKEQSTKNDSGVKSNESKKIEWTPHRHKHVPQKNLSWKEVISYTKHGDAKYKHGIDIETIERLAWDKGISVNNGKNWKVIKFDHIIGAKTGIETPYMRIEMSSNTIHGHPITPAEYLGYVK